MNIITRDELNVRCDGVWKKRKCKDFAISSPWDNPADWEDAEWKGFWRDAGFNPDAEGLKSFLITDPFILVWIDVWKGRYEECEHVDIYDGMFDVKNTATVDEVFYSLQAAVYFPEGARVNGIGIRTKFSSREFLCYTDIDGTILILSEPYRLRGKMPKAVTAKLEELLVSPLHVKSPRFVFMSTDANW